MALIEVSFLSKTYNGQKLLDEVSFSISRGQIVTIIGPNGSGKSTLLKIIIGEIKPDKGRVQKEKNIRIGYVPQKLNIDQSIPISVADFLNLCGKNISEIVERISISKLLNIHLHALSGGQLQRVMLAQALMNSPNLLILDEPTQGIDFNGQVEFYKLIETIAKTTHVAVLIVSHDLHLVMKATDYVICLNHHVCCHGSVKDISKTKSFKELFGGESLETMALYSHHHDHKHE